MKIKVLIAAVMSAMIGLTACNGGDAKLAGELVGTWKGNPAEMMKGKKDKPDKDGKDKTDKDDVRKAENRDKDAHGNTGRNDSGEMICTPTLIFARTGNTNGGTINLSADFTVTTGVETVAVSTPVRATVNGNVSASGSWTVKDGDEIIVNLDPSKTTVDVDTTSLALNYARLTDTPQDSLKSIKERVAANITDVIKLMVSGKVQKMRKFDDVRITGNTMTLEAGHNKLTFTK